MISEAKLREIEECAEKATPGDWRLSMSGTSVKSSLQTEHDGDYLPIICSVPCGPQATPKAMRQFSEDGTFIANARQDIPALTKALREAAEMVAALHPPKQCVVSGKCRECEWLRVWRGESEKQGET